MMMRRSLVRACLFDDVVKFGADGTFHNVMGAETWVEGWPRWLAMHAPRQ